MTVAIVGGGVMGEAILGGAIDRGVLAAEEVTVVELLAERREALAERYGVATTGEAGDVLAGASLHLDDHPGRRPGGTHRDAGGALRARPHRARHAKHARSHQPGDERLDRDGDRR